MPVATMPVDEVTREVAKIQTDLKMILVEEGVSELVQATMAKVGMVSMASFQRMGTSEAGVEKACGFMGLKGESLAELAQIGTIHSAWEKARAYQQATLHAKAERAGVGAAADTHR